MSLDGETPTADAVARAVVAAARVTGEDPLTLDRPELDRLFRFPALQALQIIFPSMGLGALGTMVAVPTKPTAQMVNAKRQAWWPGAGAAATEAALEALEAM